MTQPINQDLTVDESCLGHLILHGKQPCILIYFDSLMAQVLVDHNGKLMAKKAIEPLSRMVKYDYTNNHALAPVSAWVNLFKMYELSESI